MLLVVSVPADEVDEASGLVWSSDLATVIVEQAGPDGRVDLRVGLAAGAAPASVSALASSLATRWEVDRVDGADEAHRLADVLRHQAIVVRVGDRLVVAPPWCEVTARPGDLVLSIDPGTAFGSGSHATTMLALAALERAIMTGSTVLDIGSGTGVLSVAAAALGAERVVAVDIDPDAVAATGDNVARNRLSDRVAVVAGDGVDRLDGSSRFDVVVANLTAGRLVDLAPSIVERLEPTGLAIVTGILDEQTTGVTDRFVELGAVIVERPSRDGWSLLTLAVGQASATYDDIGRRVLDENDRPAVRP